MIKITDLVRETIMSIVAEKRSKVGRPPMCSKKALDGILYVLKAGCPWSMLPKEYGPKSTVHGIYMKWCRNGIIDKIMHVARSMYEEKNKDNNWYAFDATLKKAPFAHFGGKNPTDRAKRGIKYGILIDRKGAPLFVHVTAANTHDSLLMSPIIEKMKKTEKVKIIAADSAFDVKRLREECKEKNIALIASPNPRNKKDKHTFSVPYRWIVEQTIGILSWPRSIKTCWSKTLESYLGFLQLACSLRLFKML